MRYHCSLQQFGVDNRFGRELVLRVVTNNEMHQTFEGLKVLPFHGEVRVYGYDSEDSEDFQCLTYADEDRTIDARVPLALLLLEYGLTTELLEEVEVDIDKITVLNQGTVPALYHQLRTFQDSIVTPEHLEDAFSGAVVRTTDWKKEIGGSGYDKRIKDIDTGEEIIGYLPTGLTGYNIGSLIQVSGDGIVPGGDLICFETPEDCKDKIGYLEGKGIRTISIGKSAYTHVNIARRAFYNAIKHVTDKDEIVSTVRAFAIMSGYSCEIIKNELGQLDEWDDGISETDYMTLKDVKDLSKRINITYRRLADPKDIIKDPVEAAMVTHGDTNDFNGFRNY